MKITFTKGEYAAIDNNSQYGYLVEDLDPSQADQGVLKAKYEEARNRYYESLEKSTRYQSGVSL